MSSREHFIETATSCGWLENDIVHYIFKTTKIDLPEAIEAVNLISEISEKDFRTYYIDISRIKSITKIARDYLSAPSSNRHKNLTTAALTPNLFSKLIGTFFIAFNNPQVKIKLFIDEAEAI